MTLSRAIPLNVHAAIEMAAAPLLIVAPFALSFGYLAGALSIGLGVLLIGLAASVYGDSTRGNLPLSAHASLDYTLAVATIAAGVIAGIAGEHIATIFLVGFGSAHMALTASTRFSRPLGA
jgi:hypothetical protein